MIKISDMYLAAALLAYGADYKGVDKTNRLRQKFLFDDDLKLSSVFVYEPSAHITTTVCDPSYDEICNLFDSFRLLYPPNYPQVLRKMKTILYK